jgi:hypothetical protein
MIYSAPSACAGTAHKLNTLSGTSILTWPLVLFFICSGNLPRHARASITHIVAYGQIKVCEEKNKKVSISTIATL